MIDKQTIIIENTKENTFVINNDNSKEIINIKEESKIKINKAYLTDRNIQIASYTHKSKSYKIIHVKHLRHHTYGDKYHCRPNEKQSNRSSIRNTMQTCDKLSIHTRSIKRTIIVIVIIKTPEIIINDE